MQLRKAYFLQLLVVVGVFVAVSIIETVLLPKFVTYTLVPSGANAFQLGWFRQALMAETEFVAASIIETVLLP